MTRSRRILSRIFSPLPALAIGMVALVLMFVFDYASTQQSNFRGGNPRILDLEGVQLLRLEFPAGSRSNWHSHADGQLLMIESGRGRTQDRGRPLREIGPGEPWYTPAGVEHWHGASPDEAVVQWTIYGGDVEWLEGVTDEEYLASITR